MHAAFCTSGSRGNNIEWRSAKLVKKRNLLLNHVAKKEREGSIKEFAIKTEDEKKNIVRDTLDDVSCSSLHFFRDKKKVIFPYDLHAGRQVAR